MKLIDLSQEIKHRDKNSQHPSHPSPLIFPYVTHEEGHEQLKGRASYTTEWVNFNTHNGTHLDAQRHFNPDQQAMTIDRFPLEWCYGDALCIDLSDKPPKSWISSDDLEKSCRKGNMRIKNDDILLLYTGHWNRTKGTPAYPTDNPGLTKEGVEWIRNKGVKLFGIDAVTPDNPIDQAQNLVFPTHDILRDECLPHIENLANLDKVVDKKFTFIGFPIKIKDASASWIRAVALLKE